MSSSPPPADNSVQLASMEQAAAREAREREAQEKAEQRSRFESSLNSSYGSAIDEAMSYFTGRGLNPEDYVGAIQRGATSARNKVPDLASAPGTYFENLGASVYDTERGAKRSTLMRDINSFAGDGFATDRISNDSDDAILEAILQEQRQGADNYLRNLLDRGVINSSGYGAGTKDLDTQSYGARSRLTELGNQELERGRGDANALATQARQRASNFELGDQFDPFDYSGKIDKSFADFFGSLGSNLRAKIPTGLFSTSGLGNIAGAAQGAGNFAFNPAALAGIDDDEDEENNATNFLSAF